MATETVLNKLTINSVPNREVYKAMQEKGLIKQDELYLVDGDGAGEDYIANPTGGEAGQVLTKTTDGSAWKDAPADGDMLASIYDPQGKRTDVYKYADDAVNNIPSQEGELVELDLSGKLDKTGDGSNVTAAFTAASARANIATGEKLSVLFGKIAKWFADLGALAFKDKVAKTDLTTEVQESLDKAGNTIQIKFGGAIPYSTNTGTLRPLDASVNFDKVVNWINGGKQIRVIAYVRISDIPAEPGRLVFLQLNETSATGESLSEANRLVFSANDAWNNRTLEISVNYNNQWTYEWKPYGKVAPYTTAILKGNGSGGVVAATAGTDYATPPIARKVTLTVAGWNSSTNQQTVSVSGVLADATKQGIHVTPVDLSYESAWNKCGVLCVAQAANSLTFQCSEVPTSAIEVYVKIEPVKFI